MNEHAGRYVASLSISAAPLLLHKHGRNLLSHPGAQHLFVLLRSSTTGHLSRPFSSPFVSLSPPLHRDTMRLRWRLRWHSLRGQIYKKHTGTVTTNVPCPYENWIPLEPPLSSCVSLCSICQLCQMLFGSPLYTTSMRTTVSARESGSNGQSMINVLDSDLGLRLQKVTDNLNRFTAHSDSHSEETMKSNH